MRTNQTPYQTYQKEFNFSLMVNPQASITKHLARHRSQQIMGQVSQLDHAAISNSSAWKFPSACASC
jgi:hypothetical protein